MMLTFWLLYSNYTLLTTYDFNLSRVTVSFHYTMYPCDLKARFVRPSFGSVTFGATFCLVPLPNANPETR